MVLANLQEKILLNSFNHLNSNQPVHMEDVNYVISPFEGNMNPGYPMGIKLYIQANK